MGKIKVTWLGDEDPSQQVISQFGHRFVKGEAVELEDTDPRLGKLRANPAFSADKDAEPVSSKEPPAPDPEEGSEKEAVKRELEAAGIKYDGRSSLDTLRAKLAGGEK